MTAGGASRVWRPGSPVPDVVRTDVLQYGCEHVLDPGVSRQGMFWCAEAAAWTVYGRRSKMPRGYPPFLRACLEQPAPSLRLYILGQVRHVLRPTMPSYPRVGEQQGCDVKAIPTQRPGTAEGGSGSEGARPGARKSLPCGVCRPGAAGRQRTGDRHWPCLHGRAGVGLLERDSTKPGDAEPQHRGSHGDASPRWAVPRPSVHPSLSF